MPIYVHRNNQQLGPYTAAEVKTQLASGALSVNDHVWWQGQKGWVPLGESDVLKSGFHDILGAAPNRRVQPSDPTSIWALAIGSLAANLACAVGSVAAIVMGHLALTAIKKDPKLKGRGLATAGLIIGYVLTLLYLTLFVSYFVYMPEILNAAQKEQARGEVTPPNLPTPTFPGTPSPAVPASTNLDQTTNSAPASANSPDSSSTSSPPATNTPDSTTNAGPMTP